MLRKIKNKILSFIYGLPFGLKGADNEIFGKKDNLTNSNITIQQQIENNKLSDSLLKGEVTQEVEELRYRTYLVAKESQDYNYLGDGIAIKKKTHKKPQKFIVRNHIICESVGHELNRVGDYSVDRYVLNIEYSDIPRFKLEKYCKNILVDLKSKKIILCFSKHTDLPEERMFLNEMKKVSNLKINDLVTYPQNCWFTADDTFTKYQFKELTFYKINEDDFEYFLEYNFSSYDEDDIVNKFYSKELDEKYKNKERKEVTIGIIKTERKRYCVSCGKEIDIYDGDITEKTYGYPLCNECIKKINELNEINI